MAQNVPKSLPDGSNPAAGADFPRIGWAGIVVVPMALAVYLLALPLFALFWIIEWVLPFRSNDTDPADDDQTAAGFAPPAKESGR